MANKVKITATVILALAAISSAANPYYRLFIAMPVEFRHQAAAPIIQNAEADRGPEYLRIRETICRRYSWAVPNDGALAVLAYLAQQRGIVDFGAGNGYWASLLAARGVDVVAYDNWADGRPAKMFLDVQTGSFEKLPAHRDRVLMLVWPPRSTDMAIKALDAWGGDTLVYVGEPAIGQHARGTANNSFLRRLRRNWTLIATCEIPRWYNRTDAVFVYRRNQP
jgi:hypothetical protein